MKRLLLLILSLVLLGGCSVISESAGEPAESLAPGYTPVYSEPTTLSPALYYMNSQTGTLVSEVREMNIQDPYSYEYSVIQGLLTSPHSENLKPYGQSLTLEDVEVSRDVANVYVESEAEISSEDAFILAVAMANTLSDYFPIVYVNLFINGDPITINSLPVGAVSRSQDVLGDYNEYALRGTDGGGVTIALPLYFFDPDKTLLLCEIRDVHFEEADYAKTVALEIAAGSKYIHALRNRYDINAVRDVYTRYNSGYASYYVGFESSAFTSVVSYRDSVPEFASMFLTLKSITPNMEYLAVQNFENYFSLTYEDCTEYIGDYETIYLPGTNSALVEINRAVMQEERGSLETLSSLVFQGPKYSDDGLTLPAFEGGISEENLLDISMAGSTVVLNFDSAFEEILHSMDVAAMRLGVYSLVNTFCTHSGVDSVYFLTEGEPISTGTGMLDLSYPLLPNPGLVS